MGECEGDVKMEACIHEQGRSYMGKPKKPYCRHCIQGTVEGFAALYFLRQTLLHFLKVPTAHQTLRPR